MPRLAMLSLAAPLLLAGATCQAQDEHPPRRAEQWLDDDDDEPRADPKPKAEVERREESTFGLELAWPVNRLEANFEFEGGDNVGQNIDIDSEVPVDPRGTRAISIAAYFRLNDTWVLEADYLGSRYHGRGHLSEGLVHEDASFIPGDRVHAEYDFQSLYVGARFDLKKLGIFKMGFPFGYHWSSQRLILEEQNNQARGSGRLEMHTLYIGFWGRADFASGWGLELDLRVTPIWFARHTVVSILDFEFKGFYRVSDNLRVFAGPRLYLQHYDAEFSNGNEHQSDVAMIAFSLGIVFEL